MQRATANDGIFQRSWGQYAISDNRERFDLDAFADFMEHEAHWAGGRSRETTDVAVSNSIVFGLYEPEGSMVGAARVVTDRTTFGWLCDVYVLEAHRGQGLGRALVSAVCEHPSLATVQRLVLVDSNAHELYLPLGFAPPATPQHWLERRPPSHQTPEGSDGDRQPSGAVSEMVSATALSMPLPHTPWSGSGLPDPRTADTSSVAKHLMEIITAEGPVTSDRVFKLYIKGSGSVKVTQRARSPLEHALARLIRRGDVEADELENGDLTQHVVRHRNAPAVVVRELGSRDLYEVPLNEIAEVMRHNRRLLTAGFDQGSRSEQGVTGLLRQAVPRRSSPDKLKRNILDGYGLIRMTQTADNYLEAALHLVDEPDQDKSGEPDIEDKSDLDEPSPDSPG